MTKRRRLDKTIRHEEIMSAALAEASANGYQWITREGIAQRAGCSAGLVTNYFGTMIQLKRSVVRAAIAQRVLPVIAQALADGNEHARSAPEDLKAAALATIKG